MKTLIFALAVLVGAVLITLFAQQDPGHIVIQYMGWNIETNLAILVAALAILFVALYFVVRLLGSLLRIPRLVNRWQQRKQAHQAQDELNQGLIKLARGDWKHAERVLLKGARRSRTPLVNYLFAARAAQALGAPQRRDDYIKKAHESMPKSDFAIGLTQAQLQMDQGQIEQALATLTHLHHSDPRHHSVLKMLMDLCVDIQDWERLLGLLPELRRRDVISGTKSEELEVTAYRELLARAARKKDLQELHAVWFRMPKALKQREELLFYYVRSMMEVSDSAGEEAEPLLYNAIRKKWSDPLVYLYGLVTGSNVNQQLGRAERWLRHHDDNPVLLLTLGRLCMRNQLWGKARSYLEASINIEPQPESFRELGVLLEQLDDPETAIDCYRKALSLVPGKGLPAPAQEETLAVPGGMTRLRGPGLTMLPAEST